MFLASSSSHLSPVSKWHACSTVNYENCRTHANNQILTLNNLVWLEYYAKCLIAMNNGMPLFFTILLILLVAILLKPMCSQNKKQKNKLKGNNSQ